MKKEIDGLNGVYQTIAKLTSVEDCLTFYQEFKGLTITFPTKLIDSDYIKEYLRKELSKGKQFSGEDIHCLARSFDYSERQLRRFLAEVKKETKINDEVKEEVLPYVTK